MKSLSPCPTRVPCPVSGPKVLSLGSSVRHGHYPVYARFHSYIDILTETGIIGITDRQDDAGPSTIILSPNLPTGWTSSVQHVTLTQDLLTLDSLHIPIDQSHLYRDTLATPRCTPVSNQELQRALLVFHDTLLSEAPEKSMAVVLDQSRQREFSGGFDRVMLNRFLDGAAACTQGEYHKAVSSLLGTGYGLTPSGDDFLCGVLYGMHFVHAITPGACPIIQLSSYIQESLDTCSVFSRTFLEQAIVGRWPLALRDAADAFLSGQVHTEHTLHFLVRRVLAHGSTSGSDLASGFIMTAGQYLGVSPSFVH